MDLSQRRVDKLKILFFLAVWTAFLGFFPWPAWGEYEPKGKRDPFVPLVTLEGERIHPPGLDEEVATGLAGIALQGIVFDTQGPSYAVINGRIVRERETVEGIQVMKIEPRRVIVQVEDQVHELILRQAKEQAEKP